MNSFSIYHFLAVVGIAILTIFLISYTSTTIINRLEERCGNLRRQCNRRFSNETRLGGLLLDQGKKLGDAQDQIKILEQDADALQEYLKENFRIIEDQPPGYVAQQILESFRIGLLTDPDQPIGRRKPWEVDRRRSQR